MATANKVLKVARSQLGYKETPSGSNKTKYGKEYGMNGVPWCAEFVWWVFKHANASSLFMGGGKSAYCPAIADYYIAKKQTVSKDSGKGGDIVLFGFGHTNSQHIGIIEKKNSDGTYTCIEGNTSVGNNCNGGMVMRRKRYKSQINWIVRPKYGDIKAVTKPSGTYDGAIAKPILKYGSKGTETKNLQKFLNWYHPEWKLTVDGDFGSGTENAVMVFQKTEGLTADGEYGSKSEAKAKAYKTDDLTADKTESTVDTTTTEKPATSEVKVSNAQLIGDMALELSWATNTPKSQWNYSYSKTKKWTKWSQLGKAKPKKKCMEAMDKYMSNHWSKGSAKYGYGGRVCASCDKFVGLVIRATGVNKSMPSTLEEFFKGKGFGKFEKVKTGGKKSKMKHGDVIVYKRKSGGGHTLIVAEHNGTKLGCQAGLNHYFPRRKKLTNYDLSDFKQFTVWRAK